MDSSRVASSGATAGKYWSCDDVLQGISVGWGDLYEGSLPKQWIDLGTSRLADGYYAIQSTADPENKLAEGGTTITSADLLPVEWRFDNHHRCSRPGTTRCHKPSGNDEYVLWRVTTRGNPELGFQQRLRFAIRPRRPMVDRVVHGVQSNLGPVHHRLRTHFATYRRPLGLQRDRDGRPVHDRYIVGRADVVAGWHIRQRAAVYLVRHQPGPAGPLCPGDVYQSQWRYQNRVHGRDPALGNQHHVDTNTDPAAGRHHPQAP